MFLIVREMIFCFKIFITLSMTVGLSINQAVFDNISLVKIEAFCMHALFLQFICLFHSYFNLENKAQLLFF